MSSARRRRAERARPADPDVTPDLLSIGLRPGDRVRFRREAGLHWSLGHVERRERDGSIGIRDEKGAARAVPLELVEVQASGPRGGTVWEAVTERAARPEQLGLL